MAYDKIIRYQEIASYLSAQIYASMTGDITPSCGELAGTEYLKSFRLNHHTLPFTWASVVRVWYMYRGERYMLYEEEFAPHAGNNDVAEAVLDRAAVEDMAARVKLIGYHKVYVTEAGGGY